MSEQLNRFGIFDQKFFSRLGTHILIWILYFFYENGILMIIEPGSLALGAAVIFFLLNAFIFYVNTYLILPFMLGKKKQLQLVLSTLLLCFVYMSLNYLITAGLQPERIPEFSTPQSVRTFILVRLFRFIYFISLSYGYYLALTTIRTEKRLRKADELRIAETQKKVRLEKEVLTTELAYLRYQIHPHFLFNTLSFIYTQVREYSQQAGKSVMLLSDIMRYALDNHDEEGKVEMEREIQHIVNLVEIHQLRFNNELYTQIEINDPVEFKYRRIAPLLLITFVENAFKYGDLQDPALPLKIRICMHDGRLHFFIQNKKKNAQPTVSSGGIGLANVKKRLNLMYLPNQYKLDIKDESNLYTVNLDLNL
jgi:two-component system LytT family sensor kinase